METNHRLEKLLALGRRVIPRSLFRLGQTPYHYLLALSGALYYRFPARKLKVVLVTGTKGKSSVTEIVNAILEENGERTILANTIRQQTPAGSTPNKFKMTIQGRWFLQRLLAAGRRAGATWAVIEMTSEGVKQFRHKFLAPNALIFTNLSPEHLESHGSYEKYRAAKLQIAKELAHSAKPNKVIVVNGDDKEAPHFLATPVPHKIEFKLSQVEPWSAQANGTSFTLEKTKITSVLPGRFNVYNLLAAASFARHLGIKGEVIASAIKKLKQIRGRVEVVIASPFTVIVDYAHTADSLQQLYQTFPNQEKICVLGGTGGGRDKWKRPVMGGIAGEYCRQIILTNEDPYDEAPRAIIEDIARGIKKPIYEIIVDRRAAINRALRAANPGTVVLITGKGTDPYIMGARGEKIPWDDATVTREEYARITRS